MTTPTRGTGRPPRAGSMLGVDAANVVIEVVKRSDEAPGALVVRLYEACGGGAGRSPCAPLGDRPRPSDRPARAEDRADPPGRGHGPADAVTLRRSSGHRDPRTGLLLRAIRRPS